MATAVCQVPLPTMVDLALGSPEVGAVNFNILHSLLHVIIQQIDLKDVTVEFRGENGQRVQSIISTAKTGPTLNLTEYTIAPNGKKYVKGKPGKRGRSTLDETEIKTIQQRRDSKDATGSKTSLGSKRSSESIGQTVVIVDNADENPRLPKMTVTVSHERFLHLENEISNVKNKLHELLEMPSNQTLIDAIKGSDNTTPINDLWQALNLAKRVDAAEEGMEKFSTMLEEFVRILEIPRDDPRLSEELVGNANISAGTLLGAGGGGGGGLVGAASGVKGGASGVKGGASGVGGGIGGVGGAGGAGGSIARSSGSSAAPPRGYSSVFSTLKQRVSAIEAALREGGFDVPIEEASAEGSPGGLSVAGGSGGGSAENAGSAGTVGNAGSAGSAGSPVGATGGAEIVSVASSGIREDIRNIKAVLKKLDEQFSKLIEPFKDVQGLTQKLQELDTVKEQVAGYVDEQVKEVENLDEKCSLEERITCMDESFNNQLNQIQNQLMDMEKELGSMLEKINTTQTTDNQQVFGGGNVGLGELFDNIQKLQKDVSDIQNIMGKVTEESEEKQQNMDQILEELELLKTTKADREDLEDALADKADAFQINRKVSLDQFDAACDDLTKGIEDAFIKLTQQESMWQNALEELQQSLGNKLDRLEFDPLRDFVNNKITKLQEKLKALIALKKEQEAAGSKSRFLRNVNCISCDKDVIMKKFNEFPTVPMPDSMPGNRSMRPYLSYELDAVRKQKKCLPQGRNMHHLESAINEQKTRREKSAPAKHGPTDHLCNRYCGGSHTMTTPHQRVTRIGHFLTQWGPEAIPLKEGQVMGKDGQMYKARELETPGVTKKASKISAGIQTSKTIMGSITQERKTSLKSMPAEKEETAKVTGDKVSQKSAEKSSMKSAEKLSADAGSKKSEHAHADEPSRHSGSDHAGSLKGSKGSKGSVASAKAESAKEEAEEGSPKGGSRGSAAGGSKVSGGGDATEEAVAMETEETEVAEVPPEE